MANRLTKDSERVLQAKAWVLETANQTDEQLAEILSAERAACESALSGLSQEQADFSPGEGEWCISQVGRHMAHTQHAISGLIQMLAGGTSPNVEGTPGIVPSEPFEIEAVKSGLLSTFDVLASASGVLRADPDLDTTFKHPWMGDFNARQWFVFCFAHDRIHIDQIERIKDSEGYPPA